MNDFAHVVGGRYAEDRDSGWGTGELLRKRSESLVSVIELSLCIYGYHQSDRKHRDQDQIWRARHPRSCTV